MGSSATVPQSRHGSFLTTSTSPGGQTRLSGRAWAEGLCLSPAPVPYPPRIRSFCFFSACRILVPRPGIEPGTLAVKARSPNHRTAKEFPFPLSFGVFFFLNTFMKTEFTYHIIHPFKAYNSVGFSIFTGLCNKHHNQFWNMSITLKGNPVSISTCSPFPPTSPHPSALGSHPSTYCLYRFAYSGH